jgi:hypothetical protein
MAQARRSVAQHRGREEAAEKYHFGNDHQLLERLRTDCVFDNDVRGGFSFALTRIVPRRCCEFNPTRSEHL